MQRHQIDAQTRDRQGQGRQIRRRSPLTGHIKGVRAVRCCLVKPPDRQQPSSEGQMHARRSAQHGADGVGKVARSVRMRAVGGELRPGQHHRLRSAPLHMQQQRGFLHRIRAVQHDDAGHAGIGGLLGHRIADVLHIRQRQDRAVLGKKLDRAQADLQRRQKVQQILTAERGAGGARRILAAGNGTAGRDDRDQGRFVCGAHARGPPAAIRAMRSRAMYQPMISAGTISTSEATVHVPTG